MLAPEPPVPGCVVLVAMVLVAMVLVDEVLVVAGSKVVVVEAGNDVVVVRRGRVNRACSTAPADANAAPVAVITTKANSRYRISNEPRIDPASRNHQDGRTSS